MSERFVIVHRTSDPIQADLLGALLRENGIAARVLGTRHGAAIGVGQHILELHIEVPRSQAGAATDFLEAYFEEDGAALLAAHAEFEDEDEDEDEEAEAEAPAPRTAGGHPLWAGLATLLLFGGSHLYTGRLLTALCLAVGQILALASLLLMCAAPPIDGGLMFIGLLGCDFVGGQLAARTRRRGLRASWGRQLALGALFVAAAGVVSALLAPTSPASAPNPATPSAVQPAY